MKKLMLIILMGCSFVANAQMVEFYAGQPAKAEDINANFSYLNNRYISVRNVIDEALIGTSYDFGSEIVQAACASNEILVGGSISCLSDNHDFDTTNIGVVSSQELGANAVTGFCMASFFLYSESYYGPPAIATAICAKTANYSQVSKTSKDDRAEILLKVEAQRAVLMERIAAKKQ